MIKKEEVPLSPKDLKRIVHLQNQTYLGFLVRPQVICQLRQT